MTFVYEPAFNQMTRQTDNLGRQTLYDIDPSNGNVLSMTRVVGQPDGTSGETDDVITTFTYTPQGLVDTMTDPLGRVTDYDYNGEGLPTAVTSARGTPDEGVVRYEYDTAGNLTASTDENGNRTETEYDVLNRLTRIIEADPDAGGLLTSPVTAIVYDSAGNPIHVTDSRNNTTESVYDPLDRLITTIDPQNGTARQTYDDAGNVTTSTDEIGNTTQYVYDPRNRLITSIDPDGGRTRLGYDFDNNPTLVVDPVENRTAFLYDARSRMILETDPLGNTTAYQYDGADNSISSTDRNGRVTQFAYDDLDRLVQETWVDGGNVIDLTYDRIGNVLSANDTFSSLAYTYDSRNRMKTVDNTGTPGAPAVVLTYQYDAVGNVLSVADAIEGVDSGVTSYMYDALNRTTQTGNGVSDKRVDFVYNELGQFDTISRFSDLPGTSEVVESSYVYDELNRITRITHQNAVDEVLSFFDYEYDPASRITQITDVDGVTAYTYDDRDQLIGADHGDLNNPDESYLYDDNGNRLSSHLHDSGYATGLNNRLLSDGQFDYEYDNEGNMIRRTEIATGDVRILAWDHRNRLISVTDLNSSGTETQQVAFTYDALDRRISKSVDADLNDGVEAVVTHFVYDRDDVLLDFVDGDGAGPNPPTLDQRYLHGPLVDQVLAQTDGGGSTLWHLADHLGTVRDLATDNGSIANHFVYDSYGNLIDETESLLASRYLFTGREFDGELDAYYYRGRFYDPDTGVFLSEDPSGFQSGDPNLYRYVSNSPLLLRDPSGQFALQAIIVGLFVTAGGLATYFHFNPPSGKNTIDHEPPALAKPSRGTIQVLVNQTQEKAAPPSRPQLSSFLSPPAVGSTDAERVSLDGLQKATDVLAACGGYSNAQIQGNRQRVDFGQKAGDKLRTVVGLKGGQSALKKKAATKVRNSLIP